MPAKQLLLLALQIRNQLIGFRINIAWRWVDQLYARFDVNAFDTSQARSAASGSVPAYTPAALQKVALKLPPVIIY